ncbi:MAG: hypothetical protein GXP54_12975 [Deltaproteobacteria bacterium]|nr:hypothetical protein [Deltaproteobacteria bacterium]
MKKNAINLAVAGLLFGWTACGGDGGGGAFQSELSLTPDSIFVGCLNFEECTVTARVTLTGAADRVTLEQVASADGGAVVSDLAVMMDNGDAAIQGDDIAGDNVYSAIVQFNPTAPGFIYVRVNADGNRSDVLTIGVIKHLSDAEWTATTQTIPAAANDCYKKSADLAAAVACVEAIDGIAKAATSEGGNGIWYVYDNGILGGVMPTEVAAETAAPDNPLNKKGGVPGRMARGRAVVSIARRPIRPIEKFPSINALAASALSPDVDPDAVKSKSAIYLGPYLSFFGADDDYNGAWKLIKKSECPKFDTKELKNGEVSPASFKNLSNYGIVIISTHGDNWYNGLFSEWKDLFGNKAASAPGFLSPFTGDLSWPILLTGVKAAATGKTWEADLKWHRLVITGSGTLALTPRFISKYNGKFPDSIVYMSACRSAWNSSLADAFIAKGAGAVIGFSDYVYAGWAKRHGEAIFGPDPLGNVVNSMLPLTDTTKGKTKVQSIKDAYGASTAQYGLTTRTAAPHGAQGNGNGAYDANDPEETTIRLFPSAAGKNLNVPPIINGGFEEGSALGWVSSGDYRVLSALGDVSAQEGAYMGVITTGLGTYGSELTESVLQQTMCIPAKSKTITFKYDFITEEAMCYVGDIYNDTFKAEILDKDGVVQATAVTESVNGSSWGFLGGDYFAGGDSYGNPQTCVDEDGNKVYDDGTYHTGWGSGSFDVSAYAGAGKPYTLRFRVWDEGDSVWDSAATVDNVQINLGN